jgi:antitoxin PrlF
MTHRVGPKGQVVIPKAIRDRIGIAPGDEVDFEDDGTEVRIRRTEDAEATRAERIRALRGIWAKDGKFGTKELLAERRHEREREERKLRERFR